MTIALRSNYELMCAIEIAVRLNYCSDSDENDILQKSDELAAMLTGLKRSLVAKVFAES